MCSLSSRLLSVLAWFLSFPVVLFSWWIRIKLLPLLCSKPRRMKLWTRWFKRLWNALFLGLLYWLCYYSCHNFSSFAHLCPVTPFLPAMPVSMGHAYKFLGFYISYIVLNILLPILFLPFMLLIPCTFSLIFPSLSPLITLHVISISVILFLF